MKIHEYQAKDILRRYGVPLPGGAVAETVDEAVEQAAKLGRYPVAVKAQVHVGGRGKAGGVKLARNAEETASAARAILGMSIKGVTVKKVLVEEGVDIDHEIYAGIVVDRARKCPVIMVSSAGGIDIEEVAVANPERILHLPIQPGLGLCDFQIRQASFFLGIPKEAQATLGLILRTLERVMMELDASLVEINPLALNDGNKLIACDAKINFP